MGEFLDLWDVNNASESHAGVKFNVVRSEGSEGRLFCKGRYYVLTFDSIGQGDIFRLGQVCEGDGEVVWDVNDNGSAGVILRIRRLGNECSSSSSSNSCAPDPICSNDPNTIDCLGIPFESQECELHFDSIGHLVKVEVCGFTEWERDNPGNEHAGVRMVLYSFDDPEICESTCSVMVSSIPDHCDDPRPLIYREVSFDSIGHLVRVFSEPSEADCGVQTACCGDVRLPEKLLLTGRQVDSAVDFEICLTWDRCKTWKAEYTWSCNGSKLFNTFEFKCAHSAFVVNPCDQCDWVLIINGVDSGIFTIANCCPVYMENTVAQGIRYCKAPDCGNIITSFWAIITEIPCRRGFECESSTSCVGGISTESTGPEEPSGPGGGL